MRLVWIVLAAISLAAATATGVLTSAPSVAGPPDGSTASTAPVPREVAAVLQRQEDGDDEPDVFLMALATVGVAAAGAVLGLIGYVIRNRIGFWLHRPPPRDGSAAEEHH